jgi:hypothetical protein
MTAKTFSISTENQAKAVDIGAGSRTTDLGYPVADLVGRCFLRVCFWIEMCTSWARKYQPWVSSKAQQAQVTTAAVLIAAPAAVTTTVGTATGTDS